MKYFVLIFCLLHLAGAHAQSSTVAIRGVTLVDVRDGSLHRERTVLVTGNRIAAVGPVHEVAVPNDATVVEATGRYLIPGLWDVHVHSVASPDAARSATAAQDWHFPLFLAYGVTGVRNMGDGTVDVTLELSKLIRRQLADGSLRGPPRFLTAGPTIDGDPYFGGSQKLVVRTAPDARAAVERLASNGADLIKVYENLSREAYFAIMDEARRKGIPVDGHVPFRVTPEEAADTGQRTAEHPEALAAGCSTAAEAERERFSGQLARHNGLGGTTDLLLMQVRHYRALYDSRDPSACALAFKMYREKGVAVAADLLVYHHIVHAQQLLSDTARMQLVPEAIRRDWKRFVDSEALQEFQSILRPIIPIELENVGLANKAGVILLAATDVEFPMGIPGLALHEELVRLVEAGLTPLEALQTATLNPTRVLGLMESLGTIEPGKLADLVLLDANPLDDIRNTQKIRAVVADGRLYRRADLDQLLVEVRELKPF